MNKRNEYVERTYLGTLGRLKFTALSSRGRSPNASIRMRLALEPTLAARRRWDPSILPYFYREVVLKQQPSNTPNRRNRIVVGTQEEFEHTVRTIADQYAYSPGNDTPLGMVERGIKFLFPDE